MASKTQNQSIVCAFVVAIVIASNAITVFASSNGKQSKTASRTTNYFEEYIGHRTQNVEFGFRTATLAGRVTHDGLEVQLNSAEVAPEEYPPSTMKRTPSRVRIRWHSPSVASQPTGQRLLPGKTHYLVGSDPKNWLRNVRHYSKVQQSELFKDVDVEFKFANGQLEFEFTVQPHGDALGIAWTVDHADSLELEADGTLLCWLGANALRLRAPYAYQFIDGRKHEVSVKYAVTSNRVSFELGPYDKDQILIIDPTWSTYLGGDKDDGANAVATAGGSDIYVTGLTKSTTFPGLPENISGKPALYVSKLTNGRSDVEFTTIITGSSSSTYGHIEATGIALDASGNIYLSGFAFGRDFQGLNKPGLISQDPDGPASTETSMHQFGNGFVLKLTPDGQNIEYATLLGGSKEDVVTDIAVTSAGEAVVSGYTYSDDFPTAVPFDGRRSGTYLGYPTSDGFIAKLNQDGTDLVYSSYLGYEGNERLNGIVLDNDGAAYAVGTAYRLDIWGVENNLNKIYMLSHPDATNSFHYAAVVVKVNPAGEFQFATGIKGGTLAPWHNGNDIAVNSEKEVFLVGGTRGYLPTTNAYDTTCGDNDSGCSNSSNCKSYYPFGANPYNGCWDAFLAKMKADGQSIAFSTYLGGRWTDVATGIVLGDDDRPYVVGYTTSDNFPTVGFGVDRNMGMTVLGHTDAFISAFSIDGTELWYSSYYGGSNVDAATAISRLSNNRFAVVGTTRSSDFPTAGYAVDTLQQGHEGFAGSFRIAPPSTGSTSSHRYRGTKLWNTEEGLRFARWLHGLLCYTYNCQGHEEWYYADNALKGRQDPASETQFIRQAIVPLMSAMLKNAGENIVPLHVQQLAQRIDKLSTGPLLNVKAKKALLARIEGLPSSKQKSQDIGQIVQDINAARVQAGMTSSGLNSAPTADSYGWKFGNSASVYFHSKKAVPTTMSLNVKPGTRGISGPVELLWPIVEFDFDVSQPETEPEDEQIEIRFDLGQIDFDTPIDNPMLLEWNGEEFVDITRSFHSATGQIVGNTKTLRSYIIANNLQPRPSEPHPSEPPLPPAKEKKECEETPPHTCPPPPETPWFIVAVAAITLLVACIAFIIIRRFTSK